MDIDKQDRELVRHLLALVQQTFDHNSMFLIGQAAATIERLLEELNRLAKVHGGMLERHEACARELTLIKSAVRGHEHQLGQLEDLLDDNGAPTDREERDDQNQPLLEKLSPAERVAALIKKLKPDVT